MKKGIAVILLMAVVFAGCYTQTHIVGEGAKGGTVVEAKNWYALWGLVPINTVNTKAMAEGNSNYTIKTEQTFVDSIIGLFTGIVTISPRTVEVRY